MRRARALMRLLEIEFNMRVTPMDGVFVQEDCR
jgi:hypothetical protein